jgi:hypothetical protein
MAAWQSSGQRRRRQRGGAAKINYHRDLARKRYQQAGENGGVSAHQPEAADEENTSSKIGDDGAASECNINRRPSAPAGVASGSGVRRASKYERSRIAAAGGIFEKMAARLAWRKAWHQRGSLAACARQQWHSGDGENENMA